MSRSPAKSGKAIAMKSLKEKWLSIVQSVREKGENGIGGFSTVTVPCWKLPSTAFWKHCSKDGSATFLHPSKTELAHYQ